MSEPTPASRSRKRAHAVSAALAAVLLLAALGGVAASEHGVTGPDVLISDLSGLKLWGDEGGISGYSVGTTSCNVGDENLPWDADTNDHPVIAQNMYRLEDDRFEQIGMSWIKHGFNSLNQDGCGGGCADPFDGQVLGVGCSDPYTANTNGWQGTFGLVGGLGPRFEVNAATGYFDYPYTDQGQSSTDPTYKRLQVPNADLDPAQHPGARYFVEGHYITAADAAAGLDDNNASYREVEHVDPPAGPPYWLLFAGATQPEKPAVLAWQDVDPEVTVAHADVPEDGRFTLAAKAVDLGGGQWRYEYALYNMNSDRSARVFTVPVDGVVQNPGFSDVDYHSGEPYDGTDWAPAVDLPGGSVSWSTSLFTQNPNANALRWGTLYNFWFDADSGPGPVSAEIGLFRPGSPASISVSTLAPVGGIFTDGFESGNVSAWSSAVP